MVCTELAPRRQQFHVAPVMQQPNSAASTSLRWILKKALEEEEEEEDTLTRSKSYAT